MKVMAFTAICLENGKFGIGAAEQDLPGYWPIPGHGEFDNCSDAYKRADDLNAERGVSADEAARIVCSSMRKQNLEAGRRARRVR